MQRYRLNNDDVEWQEVGGEIIALNVKSATYISVNPSGGVLWKAVSEGATREELVDLLKEQFGLDDERAGADVDNFLAGLAESDLLES